MAHSELPQTLTTLLLVVSSKIVLSENEGPSFVLIVALVAVAVVVVVVIVIVVAVAVCLIIIEQAERLQDLVLRVAVQNVVRHHLQELFVPDRA